MIDVALIVIEQIFLYLPLVIGAYIAFSLMKVPNLGLETAYVTGAIFAHKMLVNVSDIPQIPCLFLAIAASMIGGTILGALVAGIHRLFKIPHLLANVLTIGIGYGLNIFLIGSGHASMPSNVNPLVTSFLPGHPELVVVITLGFIFTLLAFLFVKTQLGMSIAVYGNNPRFFSFYNISTTHVVFCGLMIANALSGISGYFIAQASSFIDVNGGVGIFLFCITSIILGKAAMMNTKKPFSMWVPILGVTLYCTLQQILLKIGFNLKYFTVVQACIVLGVLAFHYRSRTDHDVTYDDLGV